MAHRPFFLWFCPPKPSGMAYAAGLRQNEILAREKVRRNMELLRHSLFPLLDPARLSQPAAQDVLQSLQIHRFRYMLVPERPRTQACSG